MRAYAQIVKERALLRGLISAGTSIVSSVFNDEGLTARELVNLAEQKVFEIAERGSRRTDGAQPVRAIFNQQSQNHSRTKLLPHLSLLLPLL